MRLFVPLDPDEFDRLRALARAERRRPQEQAAVLLTRALGTPDIALPQPVEVSTQASARDSSSPLAEVER